MVPGAAGGGIFEAGGGLDPPQRRFTVSFPVAIDDALLLAAAAADAFGGQ